MKGSVWIETGPAQPEFPELDADVEADVAVIGGGIVGITTALVLTEAEWTTPAPAPGARAFWDEAYPSMRTTAQNVRAVQEAGCTVAGTYLLPDADWDAYYGPLTANLRRMREDGVDPALLDEVGREIRVRRAHGADYGYTGYVLRPR